MNWISSDKAFWLMLAAFVILIPCYWLADIICYRVTKERLTLREYLLGTLVVMEEKPQPVPPTKEGIAAEFPASTPSPAQA